MKAGKGDDVLLDYGAPTTDRKAVDHTGKPGEPGFPVRSAQHDRQFGGIGIL
jgi:hypothetical protein